LFKTAVFIGNASGTNDPDFHLIIIFIFLRYLSHSIVCLKGIR
jgi:hypothetical protein